MPGEFPAPPAFDRPGLRGAVVAFHDYSHVLGALRRALAPRQKHWWHVSLALTARGLTTTPIHLPGLTIEARLDFLDGHAALLGSDGRAERDQMDQCVVLHGLASAIVQTGTGRGPVSG